MSETEREKERASKLQMGGRRGAEGAGGRAYPRLPGGRLVPLHE